MNAERAFRGIAGMIILAGVALMELQHRNWIYFVGLVGFMMAQSGITDRCPLLWLLQKAGMKRCETPKVADPAVSR